MSFCQPLPWAADIGLDAGPSQGMFPPEVLKQVHPPRLCPATRHSSVLRLLCPQSQDTSGEAHESLLQPNQFRTAHTSRMTNTPRTKPPLYQSSSWQDRASGDWLRYTKMGRNAPTSLCATRNSPRNTPGRHPAHTTLRARQG